MRKLFWLGVLVAAFYGHSRFVFSEPSVMSWMNQQDQLALKGDDRMCDAYAADLQARMDMQGPRGTTTFEGDKAQLCQHMKDAQATLKAMRASVSMNTELIELKRSGFPWLGATVTVRQTSTVKAGRMPVITEVTDATIDIRRGWNGREITRIESVSEVEAQP